jgi:hypothetical protein
MSDNIKNIIKSKFFKKPRVLLYLTSVILFFFTIIYFIFSNENTVEHYSGDSSAQKQTTFTTIIQKRSWNSLRLNIREDLSENIVISDSFIARSDNLGIVSVPFNTRNKSIEGQIVFRIKEVGGNSWYFQGTYNVNQFQDNIPFPFGFPVINNSRNVKYYFELEPLRASSNNAISISSEKYYIVKYKFSKLELLSSKVKLISFIVNKLFLQTSLITLKSVLISLAPLFIISVFSLILFSANKLKFYLNRVQIANKIIRVFNFRLLILYVSIKEIKEKIKNFLHKNSLLVLVILLLITVLTRFSISYTNMSNVVVAPDIKILNEKGIGFDYVVGVVGAIDLMFHEKNIYTNIQNYGSGFTLLTVPFIYLLNLANVCKINNVFSCHVVLYQWLLVVTLGGYLLYILFISFRKWKLLTFFLLYFIVFLLGIFGSFGLERGNIDIILSLVFGCLLLWIISISDRDEQKSSLILRSIVIGFISAFMVNSKLFLLPIGMVAIYSSKKIFVAFFSFIAAFCLLGYLPNILFHSPSDPFSSINMALVISHVDTFAQSYRLQHNYSFNALASLATNCAEKQTCNLRFDSSIISTISLFLFIFTFIGPFLTTNSIRSKLINFAKQIKMNFWGGIKSGTQWLIKQRLNKYFVILLFTISVASLILLPEQTYPYRLYYALPLLMLLWRETENNKRARVYCLLSIICLSIKGFWIFIDINPSGFNPFEARGMVIFVVLSCYFMIKSGISLVIADKA